MKLIFFTRLIPMLLFISSPLFGQYPQMDFPLEIGNIWQYSEGQGPVSERRAIRDTVMLNNEVYTIIAGDYSLGYYRNDGTKVYSFDSIDSTDCLLYDFSLAIGDTLKVEIFDEDTVITTVSIAGTTSIFGHDRDYMIFHSESINSTGDGEWKIVDGLGLTQYSGEVFQYGLIGAVIDGFQYGVIVGVENTNNDIPKDFTLSQNYPNPFNPRTTIEFYLPKSTDVTIKLYDVLGDYIQTLLVGFKNSGNHKYSFDGSNLSSGIYYYTIEANDKIMTKSMVLLK